MMQHVQYKPFSLTHITYPIKQTYYPSFIPQLLALLSLTPPFAVCALTTATIVYKDVIAAYLLVGSLSSALFSSILKKLIREPRPSRYDDDDDDEEIEYGMPSNHSCFAFFGATFVIMYVLRRGNVWAARSLPSSYSCSSSSTKSISSLSNDESSVNNDKFNANAPSFQTLVRLWHFLHTAFTIFLSLLIAVGCAYSRVYLGYHTSMQVYVGSAVGSLLGIIWYWLFETEIVQQLLIWIDVVITELERGRTRAMMPLKEETINNGKKRI